MICARRLVVALDGAEFESDARSKHQPVVRQRGAALETDGSSPPDRSSSPPSCMTVMPCLPCERLVTVAERIERAKPGEIEIAEEAGDVPRFGSTSVTAIVAELPARYLATVAPPTPPPITTTRALAWPRAIRGLHRRQHAAPANPANSRRVQHSHGGLPSFCRLAR